MNPANKKPWSALLPLSLLCCALGTVAARAQDDDPYRYRQGEVAEMNRISDEARVQQIKEHRQRRLDIERAVQQEMHPSVTVRAESSTAVSEEGLVDNTKANVPKEKVDKHGHRLLVSVLSLVLLGAAVAGVRHWTKELDESG